MARRTCRKCGRFYSAGNNSRSRLCDNCRGLKIEGDYKQFLDSNDTLEPCDAIAYLKRLYKCSAKKADKLYCEWRQGYVKSVKHIKRL